MAKRKLRKSPQLKIRSRKYLYFFLGFLVVIFGILFFQNKSLHFPCANTESCIDDLSGKFDPTQKEGVFMGQKIVIPQKSELGVESRNVLGESIESNKHIYVDLTSQKLYAKEGDKVVYEFLISSGKWGRTPTGEFNIWIKLRATRMSGGSQELGTYYNLPNVPFTMYFYNKDIPKSRGYGIHGAYWHNNFGHPMSHGCINMSINDARILYDWANPTTTGFTTKVDEDNPGTPISIYGVAPMQ